MTKNVDHEPSSRLGHRLVVFPGDGYRSPPVSCDELREFALDLLRAAMTPEDRDVLSHALESWRSQSEDYGYDEDLRVVNELHAKLGLNSPIDRGPTD